MLSALSGLRFTGYEIHMGETTGNADKLLDCGGAYSGSVYGCYIHGVFDEPQISSAVVKTLYERRGLRFDGKGIDRTEYKERQFDILADEVRKALDMELIYRIIDQRR